MTLFNMPAQGLPYLLSYKLSSPELLPPPVWAGVRWKIQHKVSSLIFSIHIMHPKKKKKINQCLISKGQFIKEFIFLFILSQVSLSSSLSLCYFLQYYQYHCCILATANAFNNFILLLMLPLPPLQPIVIITSTNTTTCFPLLLITIILCYCHYYLFVTSYYVTAISMSYLHYYYQPHYMCFMRAMKFFFFF